MNKTTAKEAMRLALEALIESVDLVANELADYKSLYAQYPAKAFRIAVMEEGLETHRKAIEQLTAILSVDATQPPQDERRQYDPLSEFQEGQWWVAELDAMAEDEDATPDQRRAIAVVHHMLKSSAQPVALSTLTSDQMEQFIYERCRRFVPTDMMPAIMELVAASALAQQATPPQPVAAEVVKGAALAVIEAWDRTPEHFDVDVKWLKPMNKAMVSLRASISGTGSDESKKG